MMRTPPVPPACRPQTLQGCRSLAGAAAGLLLAAVCGGCISTHTVRITNDQIKAPVEPTNHHHGISQDVVLGFITITPDFKAKAMCKDAHGPWKEITFEKAEFDAAVDVVLIGGIFAVGGGPAGALIWSTEMVWWYCADPHKATAAAELEEDGSGELGPAGA